jgi:hypothetical protein
LSPRQKDRDNHYRTEDAVHYQNIITCARFCQQKPAFSKGFRRFPAAGRRRFLSFTTPALRGSGRSAFGQRFRYGMQTVRKERDKVRKHGGGRFGLGKWRRNAAAMGKIFREEEKRPRGRSIADEVGNRDRGLWQRWVSRGSASYETAGIQLC